MIEEKKSIMERGRPRQFNPDEALDAALCVFWRNGFEATSMAELTEATGLNKPSLYGAFGNKEQLFLKVLDCYNQKSAKIITNLEIEPDVRHAFHTFFRELAHIYTDPNLPRGCLIVNTMAELQLPSLPERIRIEILATLERSSQCIENRLRRGISEGQLSAELGVEDFVLYFETMMAGMAMMAKSGVTREELEPIITLTIASL